VSHRETLRIFNFLWSHSKNYVSPTNARIESTRSTIANSMRHHAVQPSLHIVLPVQLCHGRCLPWGQCGALGSGKSSDCFPSVFMFGNLSLDAWMFAKWLDLARHAPWQKRCTMRASPLKTTLCDECRGVGRLQPYSQKLRLCDLLPSLM
jgi:hypothetical protein